MKGWVIPMIEVPPEFIELVVLGRRQPLLAERFGVTERTVRRWLKDPHVALLVAEHRAEVQGAIAGRLTARHDMDLPNVLLFWHAVALTAVVTGLLLVGFPLVA